MSITSLIILGLFGAPLFLGSPASAADLKLDKGPMLHRVGDKQILRLQSGSLLKPVISWREKPSDAEKKEDLKRGGFDIWQGELSDKAGEYRILDGDRETPWYATGQGGKSKDRFTFLAYGDNRTGWGNAGIHQNLLTSMGKENSAFVINTGDIVYNGNNPSFWDLIFRQSLPLFSTISFQPSIGNHDLSKENFYGRYFGLGQNGANYYYFSYGKTEFIALDTTRNFAPGSPQYKFLEDRLKKVKGAPLIAVFFHHPAYSFSEHGSDPKVQAYLVPLFEKYGVDLVLTGHDHNYQRIGPVNGVTYIVTGGGGGPLYEVRENPLLKNYKVVYHYLSFEVGEDKVTGAMKYRPGVAEDRFDILFRDKAEPPRGPEEQKVLEKVKP